MDGNFDSTVVPLWWRRYKDFGLVPVSQPQAWALTMEAVSVTDLHKDLQIAADDNPKGHDSVLVETVKTAARLLPRQINDEIALAKIELEHKKAKVGGIAVFAALAIVFSVLLVIALVVAAIAGLATLMPLWLSALIVCAALLVVIGISALVGYKKFKSLLPLLPEHSWRGIRHDLGILKEGRDFDPATLEPVVLSKEEKKAAAAEAAAEAAKAKAERAAKEAENGPKANESELIARTAARREHLLGLREELISEADVKKQTTYLLDAAKHRAKATASHAATGAVGQAVDTVKERWKPLTVFAVSSTACILMLRKLLKK